MAMPRRSGRLARPAGTTVIAAQVPVALRGQAQRVSASATEAAEVTKAAAEVGPAAQTVASPRVTLSRIASLSLAIFC